MVYEIYEYASKSQATGTSAYRKLKEKKLVMEKNNPSKNNLSVIIKDLIEWGTY